MEKTNIKKLSLMALILMIFTSVFGFTNMPRSFFLMGYSAIPWYILSALLFFIPYAFMMAELGSAFRKEKGGMYSWLEKSIGSHFAFVGTFMWYASYIIWMVAVSSGLWIILSYGLYGSDMTSTWSIFGMNSVQTIGVLACLWIAFVTFVGSRGLDNISKITSIGGTSVALLNVLLLGGALIVYICNGSLAQPINDLATALTTSPKADYQSITGIFAFLTFAIFAYGGLESVSSLVDETENPEKNFPKGILIAAIIISIGYCIGILACGVFTNWNDILSSDKIHLGNAPYLMMNNFGYQIGLALGVDQATAMTIGDWVARYVGISYFLAISGAFFILTYSPLRTLIQGSPKGLFPGKLDEIKNGMPVNAMYAQAAIVIALVLFIAFGGDSASQFFNILTLMTNVAMTVPYMFVSIAFIFFKKKQLAGEFGEPTFMIYKNQTIATIFAVIVTFVIGFANVFTIFQPWIASPEGIKDSITMLLGPVLFTVIALLLYARYDRKVKNGQIK